MKRRVLIAATVLSFVVPCAMGALPPIGSVALAQQPSQPPAQNDPVTEAARQKYQEGVKAFESGKYEDARSAFLQAYALKRVPAVLLNLGQSELKSGHYEEAGNHLQQFIRDHKTATPDQVQSAQTGIADAKKKTAYVVIIVNAVGADLSVDGVAIGKSPLLDPYFVKPGKIVIYATYQGAAATTAVEAKKGIATSATLTLAVATPQPTAPPVATAPQPTAPPTYTAPQPTAPPTYTAPAPTYPFPSSTAPYVPPASTDPLAPMPTATGPTPDQPTGGREPFFHWFKRKPVAWIGAGATVLGLGFGIGFSAAAANASTTANNYAQQIADQGALHMVKSPCGREDDPSDDSPFVFYTDKASGQQKNACETLRGSLSNYHTDVGVAATAWIVFGLGAVGTAIYAMVDWYPKRSTAAAAPHTFGGLQPRVTGIAPIVGDRQGGVGLTGEF